jgi:hypothetical protein
MHFELNVNTFPNEVFENHTNMTVYQGLISNKYRSLNLLYVGFQIQIIKVH